MRRALLDPDLGEALAVSFNCDVSGHSAVGIWEVLALHSTAPVLVT